MASFVSLRERDIAASHAACIQDIAGEIAAILKSLCVDRNVYVISDTQVYAIRGRLAALRDYAQLVEDEVSHGDMTAAASKALAEFEAMQTGDSECGD